MVLRRHIITLPFVATDYARHCFNVLRAAADARQMRRLHHSHSNAHVSLRPARRGARLRYARLA